MAAGSAGPTESVSITPAQIQRFGITFGVAEERTMVARIRTVGVVAVDETRLFEIATKFPGYVERLYADYTGKAVEAGSPLLDIYAPDLVAAQQEILLARNLQETVGAIRLPGVGSEPVDLEELISEDVGFAEITLRPESDLVGQTLRDTDFRHRFHGCLVLAVWRDDAPLRTHFATTPLAAGDLLLVHGRRANLQKCEGKDFVVSAIFDPLIYDLEELLMSCAVPRGSPLVGKKKIRAELAKMTGPDNCYTGITGRIWFDENGDCFSRPVHVAVVRDGEFVPAEKQLPR